MEAFLLVSIVVLLLLMYRECLCVDIFWYAIWGKEIGIVEIDF